MDCKLISYENIDKDKWDCLLVSSDQIESQYASYWYISSVSNCWSAIVLGDYVAAFPFAHKKKGGYELVYQPFFTRSFPLMGKINAEFIRYVFDYFQENFSYLDVNLLSEINFPFLSVEKRVFQQLNLNQEYKLIKDSYSKNTKRFLKKNQNIKIEKSSDLDLFMSLFKEMVGKKLNYKNENYTALSSLIKEGLANESIDFLQVKFEGEVLGYGVFYFHKNVVNFLKGAVTNKGKNIGAMYVLINHVIEQNCNSDSVLDFGGSNITSVSNFNKKFGARNVTYHNYSFDNLPKIIKQLKNIRAKILK